MSDAEKRERDLRILRRVTWKLLQKAAQETDETEAAFTRELEREVRALVARLEAES